MTEFGYSSQTKKQKTMSVGTLKAILEGLPDDLPILAEWEGITTPLNSFKVDVFEYYMNYDTPDSKTFAVLNVDE